MAAVVKVYPKERAKTKVTAGERLVIAVTNVRDVRSMLFKYRYIYRDPLHYKC